MQHHNNNNYFGEKWKNVEFDFEYTNDYRLEVSNFGRLRSFNKISDGNIINGSITEGYKIIRMKFYKPTEPNIEKQLLRLKKKIAEEKNEIKFLKENIATKSFIKEEENELKQLQKALSAALKENNKSRTIFYHSLTHRLVAKYFLPKPAQIKTIVAHLDYNKLNNNVTNLKWMTPDENYEHQRHSPYVIEELQKRIYNGKESLRKTKLTVTKVMLLKKLLNEGKTVKQMAKQFKVSDMQIIRIRRGENWGQIPAAE